MKITMYGASNHTSVKQAKKWLKEHGLEYEYKHLSPDDHSALSPMELGRIADRLEDGIGGIISKKSKTYQEVIGDKPLESFDSWELLQLIHDNYKMIRFPLIVSDKEVLVGYNSFDIRVFIPRENRRAEMKRLLAELHTKEVMEGDVESADITTDC